MRSELSCSARAPYPSFLTPHFLFSQLCVAFLLSTIFCQTALGEPTGAPLIRYEDSAKQIPGQIDRKLSRLTIRHLSLVSQPSGAKRSERVTQAIPELGLEVDLDTSINEEFFLKLRKRDLKKLRRKSRRLGLFVRDKKVDLSSSSLIPLDSTCGTESISTRANIRGFEKITFLRLISFTGNNCTALDLKRSTQQLAALSDEPLYRVNLGGASYQDSNGNTWESDAPYVSGSSDSFEVGSAISNTEEDGLYQTERYGSFKLEFPAAPGVYEVVLHFAELYWKREGERVFSVQSEGDPIVDNLDLFQVAGPLTAFTTQHAVTTSDGGITLNFLPTSNHAEIVAIEIYELSTSASPLPIPPTPTETEPEPETPVENTSPTVLYRVNSGGGAVIDEQGDAWTADTTYLAGGTADAFSVSGAISGTTIPTIHRTERYGTFRYEFPVSNGEVSFDLLFTELYWSTAGSRVFGVSAEGTTLISQLDLFATVGKQQALKRTFTVPVSDGSLSLAFTPQENNATVSGVVVRGNSGSNPPVTPTVPPTITPTPTVTTPPTVTPPPSGAQLSAVWANSGEDKVTRDDLRASTGGSRVRVLNSVWDGTRVSLFGAKNEVVAFNTVLESKANTTTVSAVTLSTLTGPNGFQLRSRPESGDGLFNFVGRNIELFYVRYLQIKGLSKISYELYDERHLPERFRRPYTGAGIGNGTWNDRPDHDKYYPEIAVPLELELPFTINRGTNQSIWTDIFIPKNAPAGQYTGTQIIRENNGVEHRVPITLEVKNFTLPDVPNSKTMLFLGYSDVNRRYLGEAYPSNSTNISRSTAIRDKHFLVAHRHKISLIDTNDGAGAWSQDAPRPDWQPRLSGQLFTAANGYDGPGIGTGNNVFSIGTYSTWNWGGSGESVMRQRTDNWTNWFLNNSPNTEYFLYLIDESDNYAQTNQWARWINNNPGVGSLMQSFATASLGSAASNMPELDIAAGWLSTGITSEWQNGANYFINTSGKKAYMYNGKRPATGTFATEDCGLALRELPWGQYKKNISRWFFWESTYYNNFQGGTGQTNVFQKAHTFGGAGSYDQSIGETGWNYSNGDGVMFYPGTDREFPSDSYGVAGPIVSLRLKHWRRGIQDIDYLVLAKQRNPSQVNQLVNSMVPKALWDYGVTDPGDPTWVRTEISWSNDPDEWEAARETLANLISGG